MSIFRRKEPPREAVLEKMRADWNQRARQNAEHFIATSTTDWDQREFLRSGEINVANEVMPDMLRICGGARSPLDLNMLEIGCGAGRMTKMLARIFGHVTALDVSPEMLDCAAANLEGVHNVTLVLGNGASLEGIADESQDFAFSYIVFQHIPSADVIASYCREVYRVLKPGSLFKFQVNGDLGSGRGKPTTWAGVAISETKAHEMCQAAGFSFESNPVQTNEGVGTQYFWLWFRKP